MLEWVTNDHLLALGLLMDIFGVVLLAVPDVPRVARRCQFGLLRDARRSLQYGGLTSGDTGFEEVVQLHAKNRNQDITPGDVEKIEYGVRVEPERQDGRILVLGDSETVIYTATNAVKFEYADDANFADYKPITLSTRPENIYHDINRIIEEGERRFRFWGLMVIGLGFLLQTAVLVAG